MTTKWADVGEGGGEGGGHGGGLCNCARLCGVCVCVCRVTNGVHTQPPCTQSIHMTIFCSFVLTKERQNENQEIQV